MSSLVMILATLALLPYVLAGYGGFYKFRHLGGVDMHHPRRQDASLTDTAHRIAAAQSNAWEALIFFSACLLCAMLRQATLAELTTPAMVFLATRIAHPIFYIGDIPPARSLMVVTGIFTGIYMALRAGGTG